MRLSKDKAQLCYNDFLTLDGIPAAAFGYRLGNRSALEWVIDQYRVKTDKRSGIVNDPNRGDEPEYIVRLIGKVISVSLETVEIVEGLPELGIGEGGEGWGIAKRDRGGARAISLAYPHDENCQTASGNSNGYSIEVRLRVWMTPITRP